jgi:hypothetical protein
MFDEFFYRRRKNKGLYFLMIGMMAMAAVMVVMGVLYLL